MNPERVTMADNHSHPKAGSEEGLRSLLTRLEHQSLQPDFQIQRQLALSHVLQPYFHPLMVPPLVPLPEEEDLARWFLYADYLPTDGHASLIEQVRDLVTEHVPQEERVWLDSLRHSYMDVLEVQGLDQGNQATQTRLQSLGDNQVFDVLPPHETGAIQSWTDPAHTAPSGIDRHTPPWSATHPVLQHGKSRL